MNKKRLIGYLFVLMSVGCIHAQETNVSAQEYKLWYDCPHRYGQKHYLWEMDAWEPWFMGHQGQNKYN